MLANYYFLIFPKYFIMSNNSNNIPILPPMRGTIAWYQRELEIMHTRYDALEESRSELERLTTRAIEVAQKKMDWDKRKIEYLDNQYKSLAAVLNKKEEKIEELDQKNKTLRSVVEHKVLRAVVDRMNSKALKTRIRNPFREIKKKTSEFDRLF